MKGVVRYFILLCALTGTSGGWAAGPVDNLLDEYRQAGAAPFDAARGQRFWVAAFTPNGADRPRRCASCHTSDPRQAGRHLRSGKAITPLAPSVNPRRLTDMANIQKWFRRNCKWTLGRECTAGEKGDVLAYLRGL
jgi:hypothetical protein